MIIDHENNQRTTLNVGERMIAVVTRFKSDFKRHVKNNGKPGNLYAHCSKLKHITGCSFHSIEYGGFSKGIFGVSSEVLNCVKLRLIPKGTILERQKEYKKEYSSIVVEYGDGSRKSFTPEEWAIFEEGLRKIIVQLNFIKV